MSDDIPRADTSGFLKFAKEYDSAVKELEVEREKSRQLKIAVDKASEIIKECDSIKEQFKWQRRERQKNLDFSNELIGSLILAKKERDDLAKACFEWETQYEDLVKWPDKKFEELHAKYGILACDIKAVERERDRFRAALEEIAHARCAWQLSQDIARKALEETR